MHSKLLTISIRYIWFYNIWNQFYHSGPATIQASNGEKVLVGVSSFIGGLDNPGRGDPTDPENPCGPGVNNGKGYFEKDIGVYADVYKYVDWIRKTTGIGLAGNKDSW